MHRVGYTESMHRDRSLRRSWALVCLVFWTIAVAQRSLAQDIVATLRLDEHAYISYSETETAKLPSGSTIQFRFGPANADGSVPISVRPADLSIAPIPVAEGATIEYALRETASGTIRSVGGVRQIELAATLVASLREDPDVAPVAYQLVFTTGRAQASNAGGTETVTLDGEAPAASNRVSLVGAATNRPDAFPAPGEAVYAVLSGTFDWLPALPQ